MWLQPLQTTAGVQPVPELAASTHPTTRMPQVLIPEAIATLEEREQALAATDLLRDELADKEAALEKARAVAAAGGGGGAAGAAAGPAGEKKAAGLVATISQLQVRRGCGL